jgi:D-tagatose-1,6-bisphosphate aldolase subunit GatZ/KbaZ
MAWKNEAADSAMAKIETLVRDFIMAGFTKIYHDVSMPLAGDEIAQGMDPAVVASRSARLAAVCEQSYALLHTKDSKVLP